MQRETIYDPKIHIENEKAEKCSRIGQFNFTSIDRSFSAHFVDWLFVWWRLTIDDVDDDDDGIIIMSIIDDHKIIF